MRARHGAGGVVGAAGGGGGAGEAAAIHAEEERRGKVADKPREKIVRVEEMMRVVMDAPGKE